MSSHSGSEDDGHAAPLLTPCPESPVPRCRWWKWNLYPFACATLASMTTVLMGYNLAVMSGAELFIREDLGLTDAQTEVLTGSMNLYMLLPILAAGWAADLLGRRGALLLANAFLVAGALSMSLGRSYAALLAARFVTSVGVGLSLVVAPVYNAEISTASTRGVLSSLLDIFINVGILLGYVSNYAFADLPAHLGWRVMYAAGVLPPVLVAAGVLAMPESPRWLAMRGCYAHARAVLSRTSDTLAEADLRLEEIKRAVSVTAVPGSTRDDNGTWTELLVRPTAVVRRILTCVVGLQFFQEGSGIEAVVLYSPLVFKRAGMSSDRAVLGATVAVGAVKTLSILEATLLSDRLGRLPLLLASTGGVAVAMASLAASLWLGATSACLASVLAFVVAFSVGFGPLVLAYGAEVLPLRLRARGTSVGTAVGRLVCAAVSMTFISLAGAVTMPGCFLLYAGVAAAAFEFVFVRLPETRGRSLEDMEVLFAK